MHENVYEIILYILATFDVDEEHKDYIMKSVGKALREFRTNCGKCLRDSEGNVNLKPPAKYSNLIDEADWIEFVNYRTKDEKFLKISEQNLKRASNLIYPYRAFRMGYRGTPTNETPSSAAVDLDVRWVDVRKNKQGVVDNEKVQEVVNRVALGLPQYPGRIRGAGFGASKQFLTPSANSLTKADAAVLQDKYDSLTERFQAMEKRMEAGKFVEGPEASTTVKESFTHPTNHIPIPERIINNCKLFLDTPCTRAVAIDMVYNTQEAIIHHAQIPSNHLKVSIDISIEDDALLPIPIDEDILTIGLALATFVAWPKHLIDVVPITIWFSPYICSFIN
ncbi:hypothetical protein Lalb_Chr22g0359551 [Lupinus albus]|uniref:DUF8039 domain-containing protein n=1 Tax=Lupinus albus TaxID=3870 RepID=A0A6A4NN41_LUPAL|nr:hypothetical protein Lalb_Chr22g0359551 [Lupinus albus]